MPNLDEFSPESYLLNNVGKAVEAVHPLATLISLNPKVSFIEQVLLLAMTFAVHEHIRLETANHNTVHHNTAWIPEW